jgi:hypothetical protein
VKELALAYQHNLFRYAPLVVQDDTDSEDRIPEDLREYPAEVRVLMSGRGTWHEIYQMRQFHPALEGLSQRVRNAYGQTRAIQLLDDLWLGGWILYPEQYVRTRWLMSFCAEALMTTPEGIEEVFGSLLRYFDELRDAVRASRRTADTLGSWLTAVYSFWPQLLYLREAFALVRKQCHSELIEEVARYERFTEEWRVDAATLLWNPGQHIAHAVDAASRYGPLHDVLFSYCRGRVLLPDSVLMRLRDLPDAESISRYCIEEIADTLPKGMRAGYELLHLSPLEDRRRTLGTKNATQADSSLLLGRSRVPIMEKSARLVGERAAWLKDAIVYFLDSIRDGEKWKPAVAAEGGAFMLIEAEGIGVEVTITSPPAYEIAIDLHGAKEGWGDIQLIPLVANELMATVQHGQAPRLALLRFRAIRDFVIDILIAESWAIAIVFQLLPNPDVDLNVDVSTVKLIAGLQSVELSEAEAAELAEGSSRLRRIRKRAAQVIECEARTRKIQKEIVPMYDLTLAHAEETQLIIKWPPQIPASFVGLFGQPLTAYVHRRFVLEILRQLLPGMKGQV